MSYATTLLNINYTYKIDEDLFAVLINLSIKMLLKAIQLQTHKLGS